MTETKQASEMTIEQIESILENMNWTEIHKAQIFGGYGASIVLYTDGEFSVQDQNTYYRDPDAAGVIGYLRTHPWGNVDSTVYTDGRWERVRDSKLAEWDEDEYVYRVNGTEVDESDWIETETGEIYDTGRMLETSIEEGEWDDSYREEREQVIERIMYEREEAEREEAEREEAERA